MRHLPLYAIMYAIAIWWAASSAIWFVGTRYRLERIDRLIVAGRGREARRIMARLKIESAAHLARHPHRQ